MSAQFVQHSGMRFGPFDPESFWDLELEPLWLAMKSDGVKMCEFVCRTTAVPGSIVFIEAKKTAPHPGGEEPFREYASSVREKFTNGFHLFWSVIIGRHGKKRDAIPLASSTNATEDLKFRFYLVVKESKPEWLAAVQDGIRLQFTGLRKTWALEGDLFFVISEVMAKQKGLVA